MKIIGVDPGLDGGLACLDPIDGLKLMVMPAVKVGKKREIDEQAVVEWLLCCGRSRVFIERVHAMPKQGVTSMFNFGAGWGLVRGICAGLGVPYTLVTPQQWKKVMLAGQPKGSEYLVASRLWPNAEWRATERCRKNHSGLVDSSLIAEFGRRQTNGGA